MQAMCVCKICQRHMPNHAKGICQNCYSRQRRHIGTCEACGDVCDVRARRCLHCRLRIARTPRDMKQKILSTIKIEGLSGCWVWLGAKANAARPGNVPRFYAHVRNNGKTRRAAIVSYELWCGKVPVGLELDHLCRNTLCVNPWHLEPVTGSVNCRRGLCGKTPKRRKQSLSAERIE